MAAEEAKDPKRTIPVAYITGVLTLVVLAFGVMLFAGGTGDWKSLSNLNDPLPQAMKTVVGDSSGWLHMLVWLGLFGLVASFHGIIMGYARQIFAMSRAGFLPEFFSRLHPRFRTPACRHHRRRRHRHRRHLQRQSGLHRRPVADGQHRDHGRLRRADHVHHEHAQPLQAAPHGTGPCPALPRTALPHRPAFALGMAIIAFGAMVYFNTQIFAVFAAIMVILVLLTRLTRRQVTAVTA